MKPSNSLSFLFEIVCAMLKRAFLNPRPVKARIISFAVYIRIYLFRAYKIRFSGNYTGASKSFFHTHLSVPQEFIIFTW